MVAPSRPGNARGSVPAAISGRVVTTDYGRGIGIFLVVLGHVLIGLETHGVLTPTSSQGGLALALATVEWIYAFHMPLFFFLSGTLIERLVKKPFGDVLSTRLRTIAWPYLVWSLLQEALRESTGISQGSASDWWRIIYRPMMQFWFLYVFFFLSFAYYGLRRAGVSRTGILVVAAILHVGHLYTDVPVVGQAYHEFCKYGLFLAAGAVAGGWTEGGKKALRASVTLRVVSASAGHALICVCVACKWPVDSTVLAFVGILASMAAASILAQYRAAPFLEHWGLMSLQIYVAHTIAAAAVRSLLLRWHVNDPSTHIVVQTIVGLYAPIALYELSRRLKCDWLFTLRRS